MSTAQPHLRTLFRSDLIHVFDYRCTGHSQADAKDEIPQGHEIVLLRAGAYQRRDVHGSFLADPNHVLFYNQGEPYDISHPIRGGDSSTVFLFAPALLTEYGVFSFSEKALPSIARYINDQKKQHAENTLNVLMESIAVDGLKYCICRERSP